MNANDNTKAMETRESSQTFSNIVAEQSNGERILRAVMPPALNLVCGLAGLASEVALWIMLPIGAFVFVSYLVPFFGTDTHGQLATIAAFVVAGVAGIRGAMQASALIRSFKVRW